MPFSDFLNILHMACPSRTDHNEMAAPCKLRITGVHTLGYCAQHRRVYGRAAGGVTGTSEITRNYRYCFPDLAPPPARRPAELGFETIEKSCRAERAANRLRGADRGEFLRRRSGGNEVGEAAGDAVEERHHRDETVVAARSNAPARSTTASPARGAPAAPVPD